MFPVLRDAFALVCGQAADHTWAPGGVGLPFCQRCTGLYVGAFAALAWQSIFRTRPGPGLRWGYALCLLQMLPLGFHWVPHGPVMRTLAGGLFAFGLVGFLWLLPAARWQRGSTAGAPWRAGLHVTLAGLSLAGVLLAATEGGVAVAYALAWLGFMGLIGLALLVLVNLILLAGPRRNRPAGMSYTL